MDYEPLRRPLQKNLYVQDIFTAFTAKRDETFRFDGEMHDFWELVYVESGTIWAAEEEHVVALKETMFILHKPLAFHRLWCEGEGATFKVISFTAFGSGTPCLEKRTGILPRHLRDPLVHTVESAQDLLVGNNTLIGCVAAGLEWLLEELAQADTIPLPKPEQADFDRIMAVINKHYQEPLSLAELAARCHMSESKVKKAFCRVYDLGVMKYIRKLKIRDAGEMLMNGKRIEDICEALHFSDRNYFSYAFKRETGLSPREYRQKYEKLL